MIQKQIIRSVIAAVVVAGMLILCLVTTKPLTSTAFAKTSCELGIRADAGGGGKIEPVAKGETTPVDINVGLSCPAGSPVSGATINVSSEGPNNAGPSKSVTTDFRGGATATFDLGPSSNPYGFKASFAGNSERDPATATTGFFIDEKK